MNIIDIEFETWNIIIFRLNWFVTILVLFSVWVIVLLLKKCMVLVNKRMVTIEEVNLGIGNSSVKLSYTKKDQEIAYKLWVELSTRKIGMLFDKDNDVIKEVYDSWYKFFETARELLKEIPVSKISYSNDLIELTENVLNMGLRPHLTRWQAKYRKWYNEELNSNNGTPQDIQKKYPYYNELVEDLIRTNEKMIEYKKLMKKIAFSENDISYKLWLRRV